MNNSIIKFDNMTQDEIQESLDNYLKQTKDYSALGGYKGLDIITELIAGFGSFSAYNNQTLREETYVETAKSKESIAMLALNYSYRINRPTSPKLQIEYTGSSPINLFRGDVIGSYNDMTIVYTGDFQVIRSGSVFEATVGLIKKITQVIDKTADLWTVDLAPEGANHIEDSVLEVKSDQTLEKIVKRPEDLYLGNVVDFSIGTSKSRVILYDNKLKKGMSNPGVSSVDITYLEIPGAFDFIISKSKMSHSYFKINLVLSQGAQADDLHYVKNILPFFNQTFRTAVSSVDFNYIIKGFKYFKDASYIFDTGTPIRYKLILTDIKEGETYNLTLTSNKGAFINNSKSETYSVTVGEGDTYDTVMARLVSVIESQTSLVEVIYPTVGALVRIQALKASSEIELYVSLNIERTIEVANRVSNQYIGYIYYTHRQLEDGITELTYYEQQQFLEFFEPHKISGHVVALMPAAKNGFALHLDVKLKSKAFEETFEMLLENYLAEYQYSMNKSFSVKKALRDIAVFTKDGEQFVTEVFSKSDEDYVGYIDRYLFLSVTKSITFVS